MAQPGSFMVLAGISALSLLILVGVTVALVRVGKVGAGRVALGVAAWIGIPSILALSGALSDFTRRPPLFLPMMVALVVATVLLARSSAGKRLATTLPLWVLVGSQGFRLPLELVMHRAYTEGVMPVQMSFSGRNFDIATGALALVLAVALYFGHAGRKAVLAWNVMGLALLVNIVSVAILASPIFAAFGPENVNRWVFQFPIVGLPAVLVPFALFGHLVVFGAVKAGEMGGMRGFDARAVQTR